MTMFKRESKDWTEYRKLPDLIEVDFHWANETSGGSYYDNMSNVLHIALESLKKATNKARSTCYLHTDGQHQDLARPQQGHKSVSLCAVRKPPPILPVVLVLSTIVYLSQRLNQAITI